MLTADPVDGQKLTEDEVISTAILLLNAGHEATVHTTGNGVKAILESGLDPKALFATEEQTAATVEECLRYDAPLHMFTRYALQDVTLEDGLSFKQGETIGLMLARRQPRPDALRRRQHASIRSAPTAPMSASAPASTSASARRWRASNCRSR